MRERENSLLLEILGFIQFGVTADDLHGYSRLAQPAAGRTHADRSRAINQLLDRGIIKLVDGRYLIVGKNFAQAFRDDLVMGSPEAWKVQETIDHYSSGVLKYDAELLSEIGALGEAYVMEELERRLSNVDFAKVVQVSLINDSLGFDIRAVSVSNPESNSYLEVKTSSKPSADFQFFISRNEAWVASKNPEWALVGIRLNNYRCEIVGHLKSIDFEEYLPKDAAPQGKWASAAISISDSDFRPGLP